MRAPSPSTKATLACFTGVIGVDSDKRVHVMTSRTTRSPTSPAAQQALAFRVTAWGFYDSVDTKPGSLRRLNAVTSGREPAAGDAELQGRIEQRSPSSSTKYDQDGFEPKLFADNWGFYAYTVNRAGKLQRWILTRYRNGDIRFAQKVTIGSGYGDLTSLQATPSSSTTAPTASTSTPPQPPVRSSRSRCP